MFIGIVYFEKQTFVNLNESFKVLFVFIVFIALYSLFCIWMTKWWINKFYKKPLAQIKQILDDLEE